MLASASASGAWDTRCRTVLNRAFCTSRGLSGRALSRAHSRRSASSSRDRTQRHNDGRRFPSRNAERHLRRARERQACFASVGIAPAANRVIWGTYR